MRMYLFLASFLPFFLQAQTLSGKIKDSNGSPLQNATITTRSIADSSIIKYSITDSAGYFYLTGLSQGTLRIESSFAGYDSKDTIVTMSSDLFLQFNLKPVAAILQGVTVKSTKPIFDVQADKTVFNVAQSITAAGGNALELLQKSPGVLVDPNDAISMNGKSGVRIYIDERPSPLSTQEIASLLRTIPSTDVEAIEIITNPSARYEAAGNAGIINIRLKKNKSMGTNGTLNTGWSVGIYPKYNTSVSFNHRNKAVNLFGSYSYNKGQNEWNLNFLRYQNDSTYDQRSVTTQNARAHNVKLGADYFIGKKHTIGVLVNGAFSQNEGSINSRTPIAAQSSKEITQNLNANTSSQRDRANISANLNYRFADTKGRIFSLDGDYSYFNVDGQSATQNLFTRSLGDPLAKIGFSSHMPVTIRFYAVQASWEQKLGKGKLNAGLRSASARTNNTFSFFNEINGKPELDFNRSNRFSYTETIHAAFAQFNQQINKWSYQAGLRLELTSSLGDLTASNPTADKKVQRDYLNLFPSASFTYQLHNNHQLGLSFSRRIDRPSYQDLNPFENRFDELTYQKGNPFLRPQFTNNIELKHTYKNRLNTTLGFSDVQDFFATITDTIEGRRNVITQRNIAHQRIYSLNTSMAFKIAKWWNGYGSAGVSHNKYRAQFEPGKEISINNTVANIYQQHSFTLSNKWAAEINSFYLSPYVWAGNYECRSIWSLDMGLQRKVLKNQGTVKVTVTDIFRQLPWEGTSRLGSLLVVGSGAWESRQLRLNFSYRFGNKEVKSARQRNTSIEDLNKRVQ